MNTPKTELLPQIDSQSVAWSSIRGKSSLRATSTIVQNRILQIRFKCISMPIAHSTDWLNTFIQSTKNAARAFAFSEAQPYMLMVDLFMRRTIRVMATTSQSQSQMPSNLEKRTKNKNKTFSKIKYSYYVHMVFTKVLNKFCHIRQTTDVSTKGSHTS